MCRLFGFRASAPSAVHRSLALESNALRRQSREHPDGWGLAFYVGGVPQVARGVGSAFADEDFENLCHFISSETVVAHVRKASVGPLTLENTHPFEYGPWVMAHNGTVPRFEEVRPVLEAKVAPWLRARLGGDTDSERYFLLFLTHLAARADPLSPAVELAVVLDALDAAVADIHDACRGFDEAPSVNAVISNGRLLAAHRQGRPLHFSTHKQRCPERDSCRAFVPGRCENAVDSGAIISHLCVASEPIGAQDAWRELAEGESVGVDAQMRFVRRGPRALLPIAAAG